MMKMIHLMPSLIFTINKKVIRLIIWVTRKRLTKMTLTLVRILKWCLTLLVRHMIDQIAKSAKSTIAVQNPNQLVHSKIILEVIIKGQLQGTLSNRIITLGPLRPKMFSLQRSIQWRQAHLQSPYLIRNSLLEWMRIDNNRWKQRLNKIDRWVQERHQWYHPRTSTESTY